MGTVFSVGISARLVLDMHSLNNEGTEGNQQLTRMVHIIDHAGQRAVVNAISGDMFKHIFVEHLVPLLEEAGEPLSPGAKILDADRINALNPAFVDFCEKEQSFTVNGRTEKRMAMESEILDKMLQDCSLTDIAGALVTRRRAVGRKSTVEFGWVVGLPDRTVTEQYFHVKYAPEGRAAATGADTVAGRQAIFHRPASSGIYALVCNLDVCRIGANDVTRKAAVPAASRKARAVAAVWALAATLLKPAGAQRNTQNPHIVACEGAVAVSSSSLPAPVFSPLSDRYADEVGRAAEILNAMRPGSVEVRQFRTLSEGMEILANIAESLEVPGA
ncbi:MAG: DevR family CRISPR-associated autoregulator [Bacillota bacterium]|nr:DevR family CRISPR-associated autoregulator [Bacillota bacterium]